jgi:hypothetical protein
METPTKPKRIRKPRSSGGTSVIQFRQGTASGLLARGMNREGSPSKTAREDLLEYYRLCSLAPLLLEAMDRLRAAYGGSFSLEVVAQTIKTLPKIE